MRKRVRFALHCYHHKCDLVRDPNAEAKETDLVIHEDGTVSVEAGWVCPKGIEEWNRILKEENDPDIRNDKTVERIERLTYDCNHSQDILSIEVNT